jgi:hypothetical protein
MDMDQIQQAWIKLETSEAMRIAMGTECYLGLMEPLWT